MRAQAVSREIVNTNLLREDMHAACAKHDQAVVTGVRENRGSTATASSQSKRCRRHGGRLTNVKRAGRCKSSRASNLTFQPCDVFHCKNMNLGRANVIETSRKSRGFR